MSEPTFKKGMTVQRTKTWDNHSNPYYQGMSFTLTADSTNDYGLECVIDPLGQSHYVDYLTIITEEVVDQWEYFSFGPVSGGEVTGLANKYGKKGWEVVSLIPFNNFDFVTILFKRKVQ